MTLSVIDHTPYYRLWIVYDYMASSATHNGWYELINYAIIYTYIQLPLILLVPHIPHQLVVSRHGRPQAKSIHTSEMN